MNVRNNVGRKQTRRNLYSDLRNSIDQDIKPLLKDKNEQQTIGGYFAIVVIVFTLIEYLGRLRYGNQTRKNGTRDATKWMRKYMGKCNNRYVDISGLLVDMFRHGTVHIREPQQYLYAVNLGFGWKLTKNEDQQDHLKILKGKYLVISLNQLVQDLEKAIDLYWDDLNNSDQIEEIFRNTYHELKMPKLVSSLPAYLKNDFDIIKKELIPW